MTRAPRAMASWTATVPSAPDAPWISRVSPVLIGEQVQDAVGAVARHGQCGRARPVQAGRLGGEGGRSGERVLGVGAAVGPAQYLVAHLQIVDALAHGVDDPGDLPAGDGGQGGGEDGFHGPGADLAVHRVDADSLYTHADLAGAGLGDVGLRLGFLRVQHGRNDRIGAPVPLLRTVTWPRRGGPGDVVLCFDCFG